MEIGNESHGIKVLQINIRILLSGKADNITLLTLFADACNLYTMILCRLNLSHIDRVIGLQTSEYEFTPAIKISNR